MLTPLQVDQFQRDGVLVVPRFYDVARQITPIQQGIHGIIGLLIRKYGLAIEHPAFAPQNFDVGYQQLIAHDRKIGGEVYDAVKQIPAFMRLVACEQHDALLSQLRQSTLPGVAAGGYGIRIDNPNEERFRAPWHQDYTAQFRSIDGLVFWSPLVPVTPELGPVEVCLGSHREGPVRVHTADPNNPDKTGAYGLILEDETARVARYDHAAPLSQPGDLIILDFLVIHRSGRNTASRSRWSMQLRYFNFENPVGIRIGWKGCFAAGVKLTDVHPELVVAG